MRLAEFILANREPILAEWETFARTCTPAAGTMDVDALRDHASAMLTVIADDLRTPQSGKEQTAKSKGLAAVRRSDPATAAEEHGAGRAGSGFTVEQMVAEYRALRASVVRLWTKKQGQLTTPDIEDLTRFNEAIDQALAESVARFGRDLDYAKEMFLAILGHDLRTPLGAIDVSVKFMLETGELPEPHRTLTSRIASASERANRMVGDLLDFTRSRLGGGIPVAPAETSVGEIVRGVVDEIAAVHPDRRIRVETHGADRGEWDGARIAQAVANIVGNAVEHTDADATVTVDVRGSEREVAIAIHNDGPVIPPDQLDGIFNPMKAGYQRAGSAIGPSGSLGMGLYIAERIVHAHQGRIDVESAEGRGTTFTVRLPRRG
jgi:signal transduction histidine kinase